MRSVFRNFAICTFLTFLGLLLSTAPATAQLNPNKNIAWPGSCGTAGTYWSPSAKQCLPIQPANMTWPTSCNTAGSVWSPQAGQCITLTGTGGLPVNNPQFSGTLQGPTASIPSLSASVNSQFNVLQYGAKGDCITDDTAAFDAAQTAAIAIGVGNSLPGTIVAPKPPGGCYIVSNWTWKGVSIDGLSPAGLGPASPKTYPVTLKSKPGTDILHVPDPLVTTGQTRIYPGWSIRNIGFLVDNSVAGSFPHRWPGRWFDDGAMTAGSAVFSSANRYANITCGDIGEPILVSGAGAGGADLVTTIASVTPCWNSPSSSSWKIVTLAAAASTTVSNAHSYISVLNLPVTVTLGNAAIAQDLKDGLSSHWIGTLLTGNYGKMENVSFTTTNGASYTSPNNYPVAFFTQGIPWLYGIDVRNFLVNGFYFGIAQTAPELNSFQQSDSGDYEKWDHGLFFFNVSPWLSYNGLVQHLSDLQIAGPAGPQVLQLSNAAFDSPIGWIVENMGFESPGSNTVWGWRVDGSFHYFNNVSLTGNGTGQIGYWDADNSVINGGSTGVHLNGHTNEMDTGGLSTGFVEAGLGNHSKWGYNGNPFNGLPNTAEVAATPYKGSNTLLNRFTTDAMVDGNTSTNYVREDLFMWPQDMVFGSGLGWGNVVVQDSTSPTGAYINFPAGQRFNQFQQYVMGKGRTGNSIVVGTDIPATGAIIYFQAKCNGGAGNFRPAAQTFGGTIVNPTLMCTTSWQNYSLNVQWAPVDVGKPFYFGADAATPQTFQVAYFFIQPYTLVNGKAVTGSGAAIPSGPATSVQNNVAIFSDNNGAIGDSSKPIAGAGAGLVSGPISGTVANHIPVYSGTNGQTADSGITIAARALTGSIGGSALTAGQCTSGTASITGAVTSGVAYASPVADPGAGFTWNAFISASNTITVRVCAAAAGTPTATTYQVTYQP